MGFRVNAEAPTNKIMKAQYIDAQTGEWYKVTGLTWEAFSQVSYDGNQYNFAMTETGNNTGHYYLQQASDADFNGRTLEVRIVETPPASSVVDWVLWGTGPVTLDAAGNEVFPSAGATTLPDMFGMTYDVFMDTIFAAVVGRNTGVGTATESYHGAEDDLRFTSTFDTNNNRTVTLAP
jgi:hypothetical protein